MPLEFLNTGYGTLVKKRLLEERHLVGIVNLECEKDIFPDATTSVGILLYDCAVECSKVSFYSLKKIEELQSLDSLEPTTIVDVDKLDPKSKWLPYFQSNKVSFNQELMVQLDYYGRFSRGIATGANEFFVLSKSRVASLELSLDDCHPCITRSSQISRPIFSDKDVSEMLEADIPAFLFSANGTASAGAKRYIRHGESLGYHERFLTKHRTPWYKTESRSPSPLLLGVFSRGGYKIILNRSNALNLTCYHGFQPNLFGLQYVNHLFLYFLSKAGREIIGLSMRKYGDSLDKFEPNDLNSAFVPKPDFFDTITDKEIAEGIRIVSSEGILPDVLEVKFAQLNKSPTMQSTQRLPASCSMLGRFAPGMDHATGSRG
jgi:adenine-specific DNA-methyltransferase